jgi:hypothetical protein
MITLSNAAQNPITKRTFWNLTIFINLNCEK